MELARRASSTGRRREKPYLLSRPPMAIAAAAAISSTAEIISAARAPDRNALVCPISDPNKATPRTLRGVKDAGRETRSRLLDTAKERRCEWRHQHAKAAAHGKKLHEDGPIAGAAIDPQESEASGRRNQRSGGDDGRGAKSLGELRRYQIDRQHRPHHWHEGQTGRERGPAIDLLKIETEDKNQSVKRDIDQRPTSEVSANMRCRNSESGNIGACARRSWSKNNMASATKPPKAETTQGLVQPMRPPSMIAPANMPSTPIAAACPGRSSSCCARVVSVA